MGVRVRVPPSAPFFILGALTAPFFYGVKESLWLHFFILQHIVIDKIVE
jgi:hypothetical protein